MEVGFAQLRQKMVDSQIRPVDVTKLSVLAAFLDMPREIFVPSGKEYAAYADSKIEIAAAKNGHSCRYMMPPAALARLIQLADIGKNDFILDIGAATGYSAAVMAQLGSAVVALESDANLLEHAEKLFATHKCENITIIQADLAQGWMAQAPYDVILLEGAVDFIPEALFAQLREGGRLVAVEGLGMAAFASLYQREDGAISRRQVFNLALDTLPGFTKQSEFTL